jgi:ABC-type Mn2+/Zn2+ transport system ATPase subunit
LGGLLVMSSTVRPGQVLLLTNKVTQKEQECRVAYVGGHDPQSLEVAVEFPVVAPDFWRLTAYPRAALSASSSDTKTQVG